MNIKESLQQQRDKAKAEKAQLKEKCKEDAKQMLDEFLPRIFQRSYDQSPNLSKYVITVERYAGNGTEYVYSVKYLESNVNFPYTEGAILEALKISEQYGIESKEVSNGFVFEVHVD